MPSKLSLFLFLPAYPKETSSECFKKPGQFVLSYVLGVFFLAADSLVALDLPIKPS